MTTMINTVMEIGRRLNPGGIDKTYQTSSRKSTSDTTVTTTTRQNTESIQLTGRGFINEEGLYSYDDHGTADGQIDTFDYEDDDEVDFATYKPRNTKVLDMLQSGDATSLSSVGLNSTPAHLRNRYTQDTTHESIALANLPLPSHGLYREEAINFSNERLDTCVEVIPERVKKEMVSKDRFKNFDDQSSAEDSSSVDTSFIMESYEGTARSSLTSTMFPRGSYRSIFWGYRLTLFGKLCIGLSAGFMLWGVISISGIVSKRNDAASSPFNITDTAAPTAEYENTLPDIKIANDAQSPQPPLPPPKYISQICFAGITSLDDEFASCLSICAVAECCFVDFSSSDNCYQNHSKLCDSYSACTNVYLPHSQPLSPPKGNELWDACDSSSWNLNWDMDWRTCEKKCEKAKCCVANYSFESCFLTDEEKEICGLYAEPCEVINPEFGKLLP